MTWHLEIHTIDVGQGESSLIIAFDPDIPKWSSILIDGGLPGYALPVHCYIYRCFASIRRFHNIDIQKLDHLLVSHYDNDHSGGITAILDAQNLSTIVLRIAQFTATAAIKNREQTQIPLAAIIAAVAYASICGATESQVQEAESAAQGCTSTDIPSAIDWGIEQATNKTGLSPASGTSLIPMPRVVPDITSNVVTVTFDGLEENCTVGGLQTRLCVALTQLLSSRTKNGGAGFYTSQLYSQCDVIDIGDAVLEAPDSYKTAVTGQVRYTNDEAVKLNLERRWSLTPEDLGTEILWSSLSQKNVTPPLDAPALFVVANNQYIWQKKTPIPGGLDGNSLSIGLILLFGNFAFYTGGDLPSAGENSILEKVKTYQLPVPGTDTGPGTERYYPQVTKISYFKCGHHGSRSATDKGFVNGTKASAAVISCGYNGSYRHPDQQVITNLQRGPLINNFYLTNCNFRRLFIPASRPGTNLNEQFAGWKSRVAGCNFLPNLSPHQNPRGNIVLLADQADVNTQNEFTIFYDCPVLTSPDDSGKSSIVSKPYYDLHKI